MAKRVTWRPAAVAVALLLAAGISGAAFQNREPIGWLGAGDWQMREDKGEVCLVDSVESHSDRRIEKSRRWSVSNPTIKADSGKLLGYDTKGGGPRAHLVGDKKDKGASTRWAFEVVSRVEPGPSKEEKDLKEGPSGITFRVAAADGPHKGWYLAADPPKGRVGVKRRLVLVRAKKDATVFTYVGEYYFPDHK